MTLRPLPHTLNRPPQPVVTQAPEPDTTARLPAWALRWGLRWAGAARPIYWRELKRWRTHRGWRFVDRRLLLAILIFGVCPTLSLFFSFPLFPVFAFATQLLLSLLLYGLATQRAAMFIAAERERSTWDLVRITTLTPAEIVAGKLLALFQHLWEALLTVAGLRGFTFILGIMALFAYAQQGSFLGNTFAEASLYLLLLTAAGLLWSLWLYADALYSCGIGVLASTLARSAGTALQIAFGLHLAILIGLLWPVFQLTFLAAQPILKTGAPPLLRVGLWVGLPLTAAALARLALTGICFAVAFRRAAEND